MTHELLYLKKEGYDLLYYGFDSAVMPTVYRDGLNIVRGCLARSFRQ
jgi:hypothetical protein